MKKLLYYFYSFLFKIYRLFKVQENRISLVSPHNAYFTDSLKFVKDEFSKRGDYEFNRVSSNDLKSILGTLKFFTKSAYKIATSKFVFLNDNFMPFSNVRFSEKTKVIQLWHGQGVFKKFGLDSQLTDTERQLAKKCADKIGINLKEGVYLGVTGPSYETPCEVRMFEKMGANLIGMSTVPETIVARHMGVPVFGVSVITNCGLSDQKGDHEDVQLQGRKAGERMSTLFVELIKQL